jgi:uncharacterized protein (TIGR03435 family)
MMRASAVIACAVFSTAIFGLSSPRQASFDIADVHAGPRTPTPVMRAILRGGRYELRNATMVDLVRTAYNIEVPENIFGGPSWVEFDRFDIVAKAANDTPQETLRSMLQALLAERFKLKVHNDTKPMPSFVLTQGKGKHRLKEADPSGKTGCQTQGLAIRMADGRAIPETTSSCRNVTMEAFAKELRTIAPGYFTTPVINATELNGSWDFDLKFTPKSLAGAAGPENVTIFDAVDKLIGLKLEERSLPRTVLVIDEVNKTPTANSPDIEKMLPALPPAEFEVATLKPLDPNAPARFSGTIGVLPGGRVNLPPLNVRSLISLAWQPINTNEIVGLPKWVDSARFALVAKVPEEYVPANGPTASLLDIAPMMQRLVIEQFKMKSHFESRPVTAYTLVSAKPKLKKADPSARTGCKSANTTAAFVLVGNTSLPSTQVTCQNITMAQFVDQLQMIASSYIRYPVVDASGLEGAWDFSFTFTSINPALLASTPFGAPAGGGDAPGASVPIGGTTIFDALEKQLGLKLEMEKRSYPVFVVDHMEEKPAEN